MSARPKNKLFDLDIDEVSVVDRPANQGGLIAFAKAAGAGEDPTQEDNMPEEIFDAEGASVDVEQLEHGDVVYDDDGNEYVYVVDEDDVEIDEQEMLADDESDELAEVGKAGPKAMWSAARQGFAGSSTAPYSSPGRVGAHFGRNKKAYKYGAAATAGGTALGAGGGYVAGRASKSLGDSVLEELSKAVGDSDRDEVIAKAMDVVEVYKAQTEQMAAQLEAIEDERVTEAFISKAAEYNLPVAPGVLGPILKAAATVLTDEQLDILDELFNSVGDALYDEIGYVGDTDNVSVLDQVNAVAGEMVGKSDLTSAEALVAAFDANPAAYDAYIAEQNGR